MLSSSYIVNKPHLARLSYPDAFKREMTDAESTTAYYDVISVVIERKRGVGKNHELGNFPETVIKAAT